MGSLLSTSPSPPSIYTWGDEAIELVSAGMALDTQVCNTLSIRPTVTVGPRFSIPLSPWSRKCPGISSPEGVPETLVSKPHTLVFYLKYTVTEAVLGCYPIVSWGRTECKNSWWNPANKKRGVVVGGDFLPVLILFIRFLSGKIRRHPPKVRYAEGYRGV